MPTTKAALHLAVPLLVCLSAIEAHAGVTMFDRRYGPSEARGSPREVVEISAPYAYPGLRNLAIAWSFRLHQLTFVTIKQTPSPANGSER